MGAGLLGPHPNTVKAAVRCAGQRRRLENVRLSEQAELAVDYYELRAQDSLKDPRFHGRAYQETLDLNTQSVSRRPQFRRSRGASGSAVPGCAGSGHESGNSARAVRTCHRGLDRPARLDFLAPNAYKQILPRSLRDFPPNFSSGVRTSPPPNAPWPSKRADRHRKAAYFRISSWAQLQALEILPSGIGLRGRAASGRSVRAWRKPFSMPACAGRPCSSITRIGSDRCEYRQTVLTAFQQVEDNLASLRILSQDIEQQDAAVEAAGRSLRKPPPATGRARSLSQRDRGANDPAERSANSRELPHAANGRERPADQGARRRLGRNNAPILAGLESKNSSNAEPHNQVDRSLRSWAVAQPNCILRSRIQISGRAAPCDCRCFPPCARFERFQKKTKRSRNRKNSGWMIHVRQVLPDNSSCVPRRVSWP